MSDINICLIEPEIPQNTGNVARTCAVTGAALHLVRPLGFGIDDAKMRRAGLDYWDKLDITFYDGIDEFLSATQGEKRFFFTKKGPVWYTDADCSGRVFLIFGKESVGLPEDLIASKRDETARIPMIGDSRCLNLSNSVAVAVYEALRQRGFSGMKCVF